MIRNFNNSSIKDKDIESLVQKIKSDNIDSLILSNNFITDKGLKVLLKNIKFLNLRKLDLQYNLLSDSALEHIYDYAQAIESPIKLINLSSNSLLNCKEPEMIKQIQNLGVKITI